MLISLVEVLLRKLVPLLQHVADGPRCEVERPRLYVDGLRERLYVSLRVGQLIVLLVSALVEQHRVFSFLFSLLDQLPLSQSCEVIKELFFFVGLEGKVGVLQYFFYFLGPLRVQFAYFEFGQIKDKGDVGVGLLEGLYFCQSFFYLFVLGSGRKYREVGAEADEELADLLLLGQVVHLVVQL